MRYSSLSSGSEGNALLVEAGPAGAPVRILVDCGLGLRDVQERLAQRRLAPSDLHLIFVTHEHADHCAGVAKLARACELPVACTHGTLVAMGAEALAGLTVLTVSPHRSIDFMGLSLEPIPVPHDAREPVALAVSDQRHRMAVVTDLGSYTPHLISCLQGLDAIFLEFNHDAQMLEEGSYPPKLKSRVGGPHGHLSNVTAAELLGRLLSARLQHITAAHLSQQNNHPDRVRASVAGLPLGQACFEVASQDHGMPWVSLA